MSNLTQIKNEPTRYRTNNAPSLLNLVFVYDRNLIGAMSYESPIGFNDHVTLIAPPQFSNPHCSPTIKNLRLANYEVNNEHFLSFKISYSNASSQWLFFKLYIDHNLQHVPETIKNSHPKPWNFHCGFFVNRQCASHLSSIIKLAKYSYEHNLVEIKSSCSNI